jgi:hypothetical protein
MCLKCEVKKTISDKLSRFLIDNGYHDILTDLYSGDDSKNYFDISTSDKSKISYLKGDRVPEDKSLLFDSDYRKSKAYHTKIGKLLSLNISQKRKQEVSATFFNNVVNENKLFLTSDICKYYHVDNYFDSNNGSVLSNSCMRYGSLQGAVKLYEKFGHDKVELLVLTDKDDKLLARALFWKEVSFGDDIGGYLDRVYSTNNNYQNLLYQWAKDKGIMTFNNISGTLSVDVKINKCDGVPYFDTFKYYNSCGELNNSCGDYTLESVDGITLDRANENIFCCESCGNDFDYHDEGGTTPNGTILCDSCGTYICDGDHEGYYHNDDVVYVDNTYYHKEDENIIFSDYDDECYHIDDMEYSEYHNSYIKHDDVVVVGDDDFYHSDDVGDVIIYLDYTSEYFKIDDDDVIKIDDKYYHIDECIDIDGDYYHEDSKQLVENSDGEIVLKYVIPQKKLESCMIYNKFNGAVVVYGEYFKYDNSGYTLDLFIHKSLNGDGSYTVSESITGAKVHSSVGSDKKQVIKDVVSKLDSMKIISIKHAIKITLNKKVYSLVAV